jgi:eukaryotic-like serine/threonine-protein kinase
VLPASFAADPERIARFEREARALAALNHPHIAQIYGTAEIESRTALVMELVDGEDLSLHMTRGALSVDAAIAIARQVAEALDAAHTAGIIHRDLKPANVKLRPDGVVKVLDFGLAKALSDTDAHPGTALPLANSPTITSPHEVTGVGTILGTAAYMAPEQARGRVVDKRTDIWAFGCLLFELLTGRAAFAGETATDVLGSILKSEPDWTLLPAATPPGVERLLRHCLQKDVTKRLRDIGDAITDLDSFEAPRSQQGIAPSQVGRRSRGGLVAGWIASVTTTAAAAALAVYFTQPATREPRVHKFRLSIHTDDGVIREPVISPDGQQIAYVGRSRIRIQSLDQWKPRELAGTDAATRPFWSPDGEWLAYFRAESLLKVPANGGPVVRVATLPAVQARLGIASGVWGEDGTITVSIAGSLPPLRVPASGGDAVPMDGVLTKDMYDLHGLDPLPGGGILAVVHREKAPNAIGILKDGRLRLVHTAADLDSPSYSPSGHIVYARQSPSAALWAVPFSVDTLAVTGEAFPIGEGIEPSVARDGTLTFLGEPETLVRQVSWFTMDGQLGPRVAEPRDWSEGLAISRDGRRVLAATNDGIWAYDTDTGARSRITSGRTDMTPVWVGRDAIAFVRIEGNDPLLLYTRLGSNDERILARRARFPQVTADARRISFNIDSGQRTPWQIGWIELDKELEIRRIGEPHLGARFPSISPDGRLVAYISGEAGHDEVFLTTLPGGEGKWQISTEGGGWTRITPRGDAVVYRSLDGNLMSVPISTSGGEVKIGQPKKLFEWGAGWHLYYDLANDGLRGIAAVPQRKPTQAASISVVQHWDREFQKRQPSAR